MATYPKPGRGAWRLLGGLLPAKPGQKTSTGYYRAAGEGEVPIGAGWLSGDNRSHHAECVYLGVKAVQALSGAKADGWFGPQTATAVQAAQARWGVEADGVVGPMTMRAALEELVKDVASATSVPPEIIGGLTVHESGLDPAAVGVNGADHGLVQINLDVHVNVSLMSALEPSFALHWAAEDLAHTYSTWKRNTTADPWDIAIAHHNSPLLAKRWAVAGEPPYVKDRAFQIAEYVASVRDAW